MKFRIDREKFLPPQINWLIRYSRNAFFLIGILILSYVAVVLLSTKIYQANLSRHFDQTLRDLSSHSGSSEPPHPSLVVPAEPYPEGALVGRIDIKRIGLEVMILEGIDDMTLQKAAGHFPNTSLPGEHGNVAIAGHRDTFFRGLRNIRENDEIIVTTFSGTYSYQVDSTKVVSAKNIAVLENTNGDTLTLVTCYPFNFVGPAPKRFIVFAHKVN